MSMLANIIGFSLFGLAARFGQLGIQKRNLFENFTGHVVSMAAFGYAGYWAWRWDQRAAVLIEQKKTEIQEKRRARLEHAEAEAARVLQQEE